ncbi:Replication initiation protein (plasmid) [Candidatus Megaera polyxenophila]|nr:Replication initiation protein [Candidatus Megaera polyxenophila]
MKKISISIPTIVQNLEINQSKKTKNSYKNAMIAIQHNNLVEAKYFMTLQQKRIMIWLISQIKPDDIDFKEHVLSIRELINICQLSGESSFKEIRDITFSLIEKGIRIIDITDPDNKREIQVSWLSSADYYQGQVKLSFSPKLKPYLLQLKEKFTTINVIDLMQFKSVHAIRIYELLKQYQDIGERVLSLEEIKECCGVKGKHKQYIDFEKYLLLIAQREINEKSDLHIEFERIKQSRKIVGIKFIISKNKAYELRNNPVKETQEVKRKPALIDTLKEFGLSLRVINQILKENTEQTIQNAINAVDLQLSRGQVRNAKAMLITAIKEQWHPEKYKQR